MMYNYDDNNVLYKHAKQQLPKDRSLWYDSRDIDHLRLHYYFLMSHWLLSTSNSLIIGI